MEITNTRRRIVRLGLNEIDLMKIFVAETGMEHITDFEVRLMTDRGYRSLNENITEISLVGVSEMME